MKQPNSENFISYMAKERMISTITHDKMILPWYDIWNEIKSEHTIRPVFWSITNEDISNSLYEYEHYTILK